MADITMCKGEGCPVKESCYRFTAFANEHRQSYFTYAPYKNGKCEFYHSNGSQKIIDQLNNIAKGDERKEG